MSRMISFSRNGFAAAVLALALASQASSATVKRISPVDGEAPGGKVSGRALAQGCGKLPQTEVIVNSLSQSTDSVNFVDVEGADTAFDIGGSAKSCVIVSFSAQAFAPGIATFMRVKATLDGVPSIEGDIQLAAENVSFSDAHAYNFLFPSVSPGRHVFGMQYRSPNAGSVAINDFSLNIRHR
jgi:hypothetical protein